VTGLTFSLDNRFRKKDVCCFARNQLKKPPKKSDETKKTEEHDENLEKKSTRVNTVERFNTRAILFFICTIL